MGSSLATERYERPTARPHPASPGGGRSYGRACPFCPDSIDESGASTLETFGPDGKWQVRVVRNRYPAFEGSDPMVVSHLGPVFTQAPASGIHEVVVFTPEHDGTWADLSESEAALVMDALRDRMAEHSAIPGLRYSQAVVNSGAGEGACSSPTPMRTSCPYLRSFQARTANEMAGFFHFGNCLMCAVAERGGGG